MHYQETYDRARYAEVHVAGWKRNFDRRLAAMERAGAAGVRRLGVGALLGLAPDWRHDVLAVAAHAAFLQRRFWRAEVTVALPRITPSASGFQPVVQVADAEFVQALAALRLALPDVGLVLSTREPAALRDGLARIAVTSMSAGSSTEPGGYQTPGRAQEQFSIGDTRSPAAVAQMLSEAGYEPVWKDAFVLAAGPADREVDSVTGALCRSTSTPRNGGCGRDVRGRGKRNGPTRAGLRAAARPAGGTGPAGGQRRSGAERDGPHPVRDAAGDAVAG